MKDFSYYTQVVEIKASGNPFNMLQFSTSETIIAMIPVSILLQFFILLSASAFFSQGSY